MAVQAFEHTEYRDYVRNLLDRSHFQGDPQESYLAYLVNLILINNLSEILLEHTAADPATRIVFPEALRELSPEGVRLSGVLEESAFLPNILETLRQWDRFDSIEFSLPVGVTADHLPVIGGLAEILRFQPAGIRQLKDQLKLDLIAFQFVKANSKSEAGRFRLPVYVDEALLAQSGIREPDGQILALASQHYLIMLGRIHDFFSQRYKLGLPRGFHHDELMTALFDLLDFQISPYPAGLQKSIEVGRSTSGKCAFITGPVEAPAIPREAMIELQAKDALGFVPRLRGSNRKGV